MESETGTPHLEMLSTRDAANTTVATAAPPTYPETMAHSSVVVGLHKLVDKDNMKNNLQTFSNFHTRFFASQTGQQSSEWLLEQVRKVVDGSGANVTVETVTHNFPQKSIIARIQGQTNTTVVVGAHQDSINVNEGPDGRAPGADDNGTGSVGILEALRVLLADDVLARGGALNTIEMHWYAGEELGLLGSRDIFDHYSQNQVDIKAMLNLDMTGYIRATLNGGRPVSIGVGQDYVEPSLARFVENVASTYCSIPPVRMECGYGCSDHASAYLLGYPSSFIFEGTFQDINRALHTPDDVIGVVDFDHVLEYTKLVIGFTYELGMAEL